MLERAIRGVLGSDRATITSGSKVLLEIKGLEEKANAQELMQAIRQEGLEGQYAVKEIRRYKGDLLIAIVEATRADTVALLQVGHIKVGWSRCRVQERPGKPQTCGRCLHYGHSREECKGTDRANTCRR